MNDELIIKEFNRVHSRIDKVEEKVDAGFENIQSQLAEHEQRIDTIESF